MPARMQASAALAFVGTAPGTNPHTVSIVYAQPIRLVLGLAMHGQAASEAIGRGVG